MGRYDTLRKWRGTSIYSSLPSPVTKIQEIRKSITNHQSPITITSLILLDQIDLALHLSSSKAAAPQTLYNGKEEDISSLWHPTMHRRRHHRNRRCLDHNRSNKDWRCSECISNTHQHLPTPLDGQTIIPTSSIIVSPLSSSINAYTPTASHASQKYSRKSSHQKE